MEIQPGDTCSAHVYRDWSSYACTKPVKVVRDGKPYCTIHDPEREKTRIAAKCYHTVFGSYCGKPATEVDRIGYGRCAVHTDASLAAQRQLHKAAPTLLEALEATKGYLTRERELSAAGLMTIVQAALELAKGE